MTDALWVALVGLLAVPISMVVGWFINRRKNISDIYKNITDQSVGAAGAAVDAMQTAMETLSHELASASTKIDDLSREISELRHQNLLLLRENHSLHAKIDELVMIVNTGEIPPVPIESLTPEHKGASDPASDPAS